MEDINQVDNHSVDCLHPCVNMYLLHTEMIKITQKSSNLHWAKSFRRSGFRCGNYIDRKESVKKADLCTK